MVNRLGWPADKSDLVDLVDLFLKIDNPSGPPSAVPFRVLPDSDRVCGPDFDRWDRCEELDFPVPDRRNFDRPWGILSAITSSDEPLLAPAATVAPVTISEPESDPTLGLIAFSNRPRLVFAFSFVLVFSDRAAGNFGVDPILGEFLMSTGLPPTTLISVAFTVPVLNEALLNRAPDVMLEEEVPKVLLSRSLSIRE
jgi:hypothetical protein